MNSSFEQGENGASWSLLSLLGINGDGWGYGGDTVEIHLGDWGLEAARIMLRNR
jgi:hypothetical protein